jgi:hypothetical protein
VRRQALEGLREVLGVLHAGGRAGGDDRHEDPLVPQPHGADIARLVAASRAAGARVELEGDVTGLPEATARVVYRIVQEALTNVHKHDRALRPPWRSAATNRPG